MSFKIDSTSWSSMGSLTLRYYASTCSLFLIIKRCVSLPQWETEISFSRRKISFCYNFLSSSTISYNYLFKFYNFSIFEHYSCFSFFSSKMSKFKFLIFYYKSTISYLIMILDPSDSLSSDFRVSIVVYKLSIFSLKSREILSVSERAN